MTKPVIPAVDHRSEVMNAIGRDPFSCGTSLPGASGAGHVRFGSGKRIDAAVGEGPATPATAHRYLEAV